MYPRQAEREGRSTVTSDSIEHREPVGRCALHSSDTGHRQGIRSAVPAFVIGDHARHSAQSFHEVSKLWKIPHKVDGTHVVDAHDDVDGSVAKYFVGDSSPVPIQISDLDILHGRLCTRIST